MELHYPYLNHTGRFEDDIRVTNVRFPEDEYHVNVSKMFGRLARQQPRDTGVFSFDVRWVSHDGEAAMFEVPPARRLVTFTNARQSMAESGHKKVHSLLLNFPRTVIGVRLQSFVPTVVYSFVIRNPIEDDKDPLFLLPLPNTYASGSICLPSGERRLDQQSFADGLLAAWEAVWDSRFNTDLLDAMKYVRSTGHPEILWTNMVENYRRVSRSPYKNHRSPRGTPLQMFRVWSRLSMDEVLAIDDWPVAGDFRNVGDLRGYLSRFNSVERSIPGFFRDLVLL
jgi:hypothetical protein